jgi:DNA primase
MSKLSPELRKSLQTSAERYNQSLFKVADYLESRGLSFDSANGNLLGYVDEPSVGHEQFRGRLCIPYVTRAGVVNMKFRALDGSEPKYLNLPGFETNIYLVESFFAHSEYMAVAEGELDALSLVEAGIPAVGLPGVNSWKPYYRRCFEDWPTIFVFADGDQPGRDFAAFLAREIRAAPIYMPPGTDVNTQLVKEGPEWLQAQILK